MIFVQLTKNRWNAVNEKAQCLGLISLTPHEGEWQYQVAWFDEESNIQTDVCRSLKDAKSVLEANC